MKTKGKGKARGRPHRPARPKPSPSVPLLRERGPNFVADAAPGCHIAHSHEAPWLTGWERFDPDDYDEGAEIPDMALDPYSGNRLSVINSSEVEKVVYLSVYGHAVLNKAKKPLQRGSTTNNEGVTKFCTSFILLMPPRIMLHLGRISLSDNETLVDVEIESDVSDWSRHPDPEDEHTLTVGFPLGGEGPFLCTQGEAGTLTHFFGGNLHAIDFRCDVGTPVLAAGNGVVVQLQHNNTLTGCAVTNLFKWNSIMIRLDDAPAEGAQQETATEGDGPSPRGPRGGPLFVEYVHIEANSCTVAPGERVQAGQQLCRSGSVGFSPEPHLHFTAFRSDEDEAPTVRVRFQSLSAAYVPEAGKWYDASGERDPP